MVNFLLFSLIIFYNINKCNCKHFRHPDRFPEDEEKKIEGGLHLEAINRAYFCLSDTDRLNIIIYKYHKILK